MKIRIVHKLRADWLKGVRINLEYMYGCIGHISKYMLIT